jgi:hypothetical protein
LIRAPSIGDKGFDRCHAGNLRLFWRYSTFNKLNSHRKAFAMSTAIDTAKVTERRQLHFNNIEDILADVNHLADSREIRALGNWTPGQVFQHVATVMNKSIDGFDRHLPWPLRFGLRLFMKNRVLYKPMAPGFKLPKRTAEEIVSPPIPTEEGVAHIRQAIHRLQSETKRSPSAFLGPLTREEWEQLHCRHSELHLSFLITVA